MALKSWLQIPSRSHFSLANIPFGIISTPSTLPRPAIAIGSHALDLHTFSKNNGFSALPSILPHLSVFNEPTLNSFAALGRPLHREVRHYLQRIFAADTEFPTLLKEHTQLQRLALIPLKDVATHVPFKIGDYTDFYAGKNHAFNCGLLFRGPEDALHPNYMHLPVGYHGRASSVVVSGTPIRRPCGQILEDPAADVKKPIFAPCKRLDLELEMGAFVCKGNKMGERVPIEEAEENIFGYVLLNDWSARDVQAWEYIPLGPFNAKNFGTSISPWVVTVDALEGYRTKGLESERELLPYLKEKREDNMLDMRLEVDLTTPDGKMMTITKTNSSNLLFSFAQMLAHHTSTGCPMQPGDLMGSGTISGTEAGEFGSLLEQSQGGKVSVQLEGGEERKFLEDGDTVTLRGWAGGEDGALIGFGDCVGRIEPAFQL